MIVITPDNFAEISNIIKDYSGILLNRIPTKRCEKKIIEQMNKLGCQEVEAYIELLRCYPTNPTVIDNFIGEITITESYLFRNPKQFEYILTNFFPAYFAKNNYSFPLRIWSAGCSHGEEPYSIAMIARNFQKENPKARFTINAGDINQSSLQIAKAGLYTSNSLRGKIEYFEEKLGYPIGNYDSKGNCLISQDLKNMVEFQKLNLKDINRLKIMKGSDIIFCRNVLIYFDEVLRNQLLQEFFNCLNPGGMLFIGESECFSFPQNTFEAQKNDGSYAYRKPDQ